MIIAFFPWLVGCGSCQQRDATPSAESAGTDQPSTSYSTSDEATEESEHAAPETGQTREPDSLEVSHVSEDALRAIPNVPPGEAVAPSVAQRRLVSNSVNAFAMDFYPRLAESKSGENIILSPASIGLAFAMVHAGAQGESAEEIRRALHLGNNRQAASQAMGRTLSRHRVQLELPKWESEMATALSQLMNQLGVRKVFSADDAGLEPIGHGATPAEQVYISEGIHKAFISVDEDGTEAAAAIALMMRGRAQRPPAVDMEFIADHPFLYLIRDVRTGAVLFMGRLLNPS